MLYYVLGSDATGAVEGRTTPADPGSLPQVANLYSNAAKREDEKNEKNQKPDENCICVRADPRDGYLSDRSVVTCLHGRVYP